MRERPEVGGDGGGVQARGEGETKAGRLDLSVPQVAGGALAAVVAAKLASSFGVYGTILGAGLISVVATCGGTLFQHFFQRTGEQLRARRSGERARGTAAVAAGPEWPPRGRTPSAPGEFTEFTEFTEGTVHRARVRGRKRPLVAAALVFGVTMAGVTAYELASGHSLGGGGGTTVGAALTGGAEPGPDSGGSGDQGDQGDRDGRDDQGDRDGSEDPGERGGSGGGSPTGTPSGTPSGTGDATSPGGGSPESGGTTPGPAPTPTGTDGREPGGAPDPAPDPSATPPEPSASSRSETGGPDQDGPAAP
ncbi:hypothetical protein ACLGIH_08140 [Streptomyces sp. HMX87]|uniref:hypothetical protein n=1 Tax=Streptomyces sp. HMX87 TaxID=3390849 RepID=UPI003A8B1B36